MLHPTATFEYCIVICALLYTPQVWYRIAAAHRSEHYCCYRSLNEAADVSQIGVKMTRRTVPIDPRTGGSRVAISDRSVGRCVGGDCLRALANATAIRATWNQHFRRTDGAHTIYVDH